MFENHNDIVKDDDTVFFLGDVARIKKSTKNFVIEMLNQMKGQKILIKGNHDTEKDDFYIKCGFKSVHDYLIVKDVMLCHYSLTQPSESNFLKIFRDSNCKVLIHGHIHNQNIERNDGIKRINVCVDYKYSNYKPFFSKVIDNYFKNNFS